MGLEVLHNGAVFRVELQTFGYDVKAFGAQLFGNSWVYLVLSRLDCFYCLLRIGSFEGQLACEHSIEYNTRGPNINSSINFIPLIFNKALRRHVGETASIQILPSEGLNNTGNTEINNLDILILLIDQ